MARLADIPSYTQSPPVTNPFAPINSQHRPLQTAYAPLSISSSFIRELLDYEIHNTSKIRHIQRYEGTMDPDDHIDSYEWTMTSLKVDERFWCTYFPVTQTGNVGKCFKTLHPDRIINFSQLKYLFLTNFMQLRKYRGYKFHRWLQAARHTVDTTLGVPGHEEGFVVGKALTTSYNLNEKAERYLQLEKREAEYINT
ncbi:hypothetical protein LXL04_006659 [Taraxacum kok-saghyz]